MLKFPAHASAPEVPGRALDIAIIGRPGSGKSLPVIGLITDRLGKGHEVRVLDRGRQRLSLCRALGGTHVTLKTDGALEALQFGDTSLTVYELGELHVPVDGMPFDRELTKDDLLVVDEIYSARQLLPDLGEILERVVAQQANFCLVGQCIDDVDELMNRSRRAYLMELSAVTVMERT